MRTCGPLDKTIGEGIHAVWRGDALTRIGTGAPAVLGDVHVDFAVVGVVNGEDVDGLALVPLVRAITRRGPSKRMGDVRLGAVDSVGMELTCGISMDPLIGKENLVISVDDGDGDEGEDGGICHGFNLPRGRVGIGVGLVGLDVFSR